MGSWHLHTVSKISDEITYIPVIHKRSLVAIPCSLITHQLEKKHIVSLIPNYPNTHPHIIFQCYTNFLALSRLKGTALCLLKTKYAIKPKNPV